MMRPPAVCPVSSCGQLATPTTTHHAGDHCDNLNGDGDGDAGEGVILFTCDYLGPNLIIGVVVVITAIMIITKTLISGDNGQPGVLSKERSRAASSYNVKVSTLILIKWKWKLGRNLQNEMMSNLSAGENQTSLQGETPARRTGDFLIFFKLGTCQMFVNFVKVKLLLTGCSKKGQS